MSEEATRDPQENSIPSIETKKHETETASVVVEPSPNGAGEISAPTPHAEQVNYWKRDLRYKLFTLVISVTGLLISLIGFFLIVQQVSHTTKYQRATMQSSIMQHVNSITRVFLEKPHLRPYFYDGKGIDEQDPNYLEAIATAEMMLDAFDLISAQNRHYREYWESPEAWDEWISDSFSTSPLLRDTYDRYANWYDEALIDLRKEGQKRFEKLTANSATDGKL